MIIAIFANILAVAGGISDVEGRLDATSFPAEAEGFVEATLYVFWEVTTTGGWLTINLLFHLVDVISKICDVKPVVILDISICNKADPDA